MTTNSEQLEHGVTREWLDEGRIVVFRTSSSSRAASDVWGEAVMATVKAWPNGQPFLALYDFRKLGLTPYNREVSLRVGNSVPDHFQGRFALLVGRDVLGHAIRLFGTRELGRVMPQLRGNYFYDEAEALTWLRELLTDGAL